jgi:Zn-dependent protease with chaperone function
MFYLLCVSICFAVMFIVLAAASFASLPLQRILVGASSRRSPRTTANLIFIVRILPSLVAAIAALGLALPAFLEYEPSRTAETPGFPLLLLAAFGAMGVAIALVRCWRILRRTGRMQNEWIQQAECISLYRDKVPLYRLETPSSLLAVTGIVRPRIFMSKHVADILNSPELEAALTHELSHVRTGDNLKQFILKVIRLPRWLYFSAGLDAAWMSTSELAADEGAIAGGASALDLASALIKVGRLSLENHAPQEVAASHLVEGCGAATQARAVRLREMLEGESSARVLNVAQGSAVTPILIATLLILYVALLTSLPAIHELLEYLVR